MIKLSARYDRKQNVWRGMIITTEKSIHHDAPSIVIWKRCLSIRRLNKEDALNDARLYSVDVLAENGITA